MILQGCAKSNKFVQTGRRCGAFHAAAGRVFGRPQQCQYHQHERILNNNTTNTNGHANGFTVNVNGTENVYSSTTNGHHNLYTSDTNGSNNFATGNANGANNKFAFGSNGSGLTSCTNCAGHNLTGSNLIGSGNNPQTRP